MPASSVRDLLRSAPVDGVALGAPGRPSTTHAGLGEIVDELGTVLRAAGVAREDRVAIVLPNGPEMAAVFLGVACHAAAAPLNPAYVDADFRFYLGDLDARLVIVAADLDSPVRAVAAEMDIPVAELSVDPTTPAGRFDLAAPTAPEPAVDRAVAPDDTALVLHTSGTTSRPKIVPLSHTNLCASAANIAATLALTPADRCLNVMPLFHIHGLMAAVMATMAAGAEVVCTTGFDRDRFFEWLGDAEPTWYTAVPTMHQAVLGAADEHRSVVDAARLRFVRSSSASLPPAVMDRLEATFDAPVIEAYGMTEAAHQMASNPLPPAARKAGSVGVEAGPEVRIMDAAGRLLERGETGEIVIRGENVTAGYEANPETNAAAFEAGWFRTGDEGVMDDEGYLRITGRLKEMVNRGGEKVVPREIDEALLGHPDVTQAVAFALPHETLGEDLAAAVVLAAGATADEAVLRAHCFDRLAGFKVPSRIVVVDAIPKGATGKLQRIGLHEKLADALATEHVAPEGDLEAAVASVWSELLGVAVGRHENFFGLGGDSLTATTAVTRLAERALGEIEPADLFRAPTVAGFAALLAGEVVATSDAFVTLREGSGRPVFFVPGHGGDPFTFTETVRHLDTDRPLVCLTFPPELRSDDPVTNREANYRVAELAADMLDTIRTVQPEGPYDVVAFCFGGDVAHEIVGGLERAGATVDSATYLHTWRRDASPELPWFRIRRLLMNPKRLVAKLLGRAEDDGDLGPIDWSRIVTPSSLSTPLTLIRLEDEMFEGRAWAADKGWGRFAPVRRVVDLPGDKLGSLTTGAKAFAEVIDEELAR